MASEADTDGVVRLTADGTGKEAAQREAELLRNSALSAATHGWSIEPPALLRQLVIQLMTCDAHKGRHHFAITDEGRMLWCSATGIECINNASIGIRLPTVPLAVQPKLKRYDQDD